MNTEQELIQQIIQSIKNSKWKEFQRITLHVEEHKESDYWCDDDFTVVFIHMSDSIFGKVRLEIKGVYDVPDGDITELVRKNMRFNRFGL